jgi:HSP20 family protein
LWIENNTIHLKLEDKAMIPILRAKSYLPDFLDDFLGDDFLADFFGKKRGVNVPSINVIEGANDFKIEVAAPGLEKEDFKIELNHNTLTVWSEKEESSEDGDDKFMRREFSYTSFKRSFTLPGSVDAEKVSASHKNGVLTIEIPKREEAKLKAPRNIVIE